ncbi:unnamed protein product, partial [Amoebophrya sp. A25]
REVREEKRRAVKGKANSTRMLLRREKQRTAGHHKRSHDRMKRIKDKNKREQQLLGAPQGDCQEREQQLPAGGLQEVPRGAGFQVGEME